MLAGLPKRAREALSELLKFFDKLKEFEGPLQSLIEQIYVDSGYRAELAKDEESFEEREAYVISFLQAARDFVSSSPETMLGDFLQHLALISDIDHLKEEGRLVRLMTVHAAKGLEFPIVFITGLEEGMFPHTRAMLAEDEGDDAPIEEERRLMYVAMTRAQDLLYLSHARQRTFRGDPAYAEASRFLEEIEAHLPETISKVSVLDSLSSSHPPLFDDSEGDQKEGLEGLSAGERVYHPDFGRGVVERVYASGARQIAIVLFERGYGKRILDLRSAALERI